MCMGIHILLRVESQLIKQFRIIKSSHEWLQILGERYLIKSFRSSSSSSS